jgi:hypothetical protein
VPRIQRITVVREQDLVARAKHLRESVTPLLPRLTDDCPSGRFDALRAVLESIRSAREDARALDKWARRGEPMARAYAGLLKFAREPHAPMVAACPLPTGQAFYAPLAHTAPEAEVAVQQSADPARLLLGYRDWARRGFHFFATGDGLWCTGGSPEPPPQFRDEKLARLPYRLVPDASAPRYVCPHLAAREARPFLEVGWPAAGLAFRVCDRCVKPDRHLLAYLSEGAAVPDLEQELPVEATLNVRCRAGPECVHAQVPGLNRRLRRDYRSGKTSDAQLLADFLADVRPRIERTGRRTLVAEGTCFGGDAEAFLDALHPTAVERRALRRVLDRTPPYFEVGKATASAALELLWPRHSESLVRAIVSDPEEAQRLLEGARGSPGRVAEILKRAHRMTEERQVLDALPGYSRLSPEAAFVDRVARAYRTQGDRGAEKTVLQPLPREGKERGLAFGLLTAMGRGATHDWLFSPTEKAFGSSIAALAREVLVAPPDRYHESLERLFLAAGVADWGTRVAAGPVADPSGAR